MPRVGRRARAIRARASGREPTEQKARFGPEHVGRPGPRPSSRRTGESSTRAMARRCPAFSYSARFNHRFCGAWGPSLPEASSEAPWVRTDRDAEVEDKSVPSCPNCGSRFEN